jgi:hypothetical protein
VDWGLGAMIACLKRGRRVAFRGCRQVLGSSFSRRFADPHRAENQQLDRSKCESEIYKSLIKSGYCFLLRRQIFSLKLRRADLVCLSNGIFVAFSKARNYAIYTESEYSPENPSQAHKIHHKTAFPPPIPQPLPSF